jgi:hypothetical protein
MRKAFDSNIPKLKPRLRTAVVVVSESAPEMHDESSQLLETVPSHKAVVLTSDKESKPDSESVLESVATENPSLSPEADESPDPGTEPEVQKEMSLEIPSGEEAAVQPELQNTALYQSANPALPAVPVNSAYDIETRRERLEKVKRKVAEAARTGIPIEPISEDPTQAAESILGLVNDMEMQLSRTRDLEKALRIDLAEAKTELAHTVTEGRMAVERLGQAEVQLEEKRKVLEEMLVEMGALEEERDQTVRRVQSLTAQDEERQKQLDDLGRRSADLEKALSESKAEDERLLIELDECMAENSQLRVVLSEVTQERDSLVKNAERLIKEQDEQVKAKKALEKVHQALSQARARLGT